MLKVVGTLRGFSVHLFCRSNLLFVVVRLWAGFLTPTPIPEDPINPVNPASDNSPILPKSLNHNNHSSDNFLTKKARLSHRAFVYYFRAGEVSQPRPLKTEN